MTVLAIAPSDTTPNMYDDSDEFQARAREFVDYHKGKLEIFDSKAQMKARKKEVLEFLENANSKIISLAFFCHGWATSGTGSGIQAGFRSADVPELAEALQRFKNLKTICLYCCSCAAGYRNGEKSIAAKISDTTDLTTWAHSTKGHTTYNPNVIVYEPGSIGGYYPVSRTSDKWQEWIKALKAGQWLRFPGLFPWDPLGYIPDY